ncbi:hypothetical protein HDZ31DRAFT_79082 [Schizophyllum fasciatum]
MSNSESDTGGLGIESTPRPKPTCRPDDYINRLPNELLCAIFMLCGGPGPIHPYPRKQLLHTWYMNRTEYIVHRHSEAAIRLGRVCTRWRAVTRSYPPLWTVVDIRPTTRSAIPTLNMCLALSAGLPLELHFHNMAPDNYPGVCRYMSLVAANAHRWKELTIEISDEYRVLQPLLAVSAGSFVSLSKAHVDVVQRCAGDSTPDTLLWGILLTSPNLRVINWSQNAYIRRGIPSAPLRQLTELGLQAMEPDMLLPILGGCSNIEVLLLRGCVDDPTRGDLPLAQSSYSLPRLRFLMLCGQFNWSALFACLAAPALHRLDMSQTTAHCSAMEEMLQRSNARLRMWSLHGPNAGQAKDLIALLHGPAAQHLEVLRYDDPWVGQVPGYEGFDLRPHVPRHIVTYTADPMCAEIAYEKMMRRQLN